MHLNPRNIAYDLEANAHKHGDAEANHAMADSEVDLWDDEGAEESEEKYVARERRLVVNVCPVYWTGSNSAVIEIQRDIRVLGQIDLVAAVEKVKHLDYSGSGEVGNDLVYMEKTQGCGFE